MVLETEAREEKKSKIKNENKKKNRRKLWRWHSGRLRVLDYALLGKHAVVESFGVHLGLLVNCKVTVARQELSERFQEPLRKIKQNP